MRKNLLEFLFGEEVIRESSAALGEQVIKLFEEAADQETEEMVAAKEPLVAALKSLGIDKGVEAISQACELTCDNPEEYRKYVGLLFDPENMHTLAAKGWVPAKCGDVSMSFEPAELKINFIEIATAETGDKDKAPDLEKVLKDAQKFAATEPEHDDDMNPVEFDDKTSDNRKKGVGDAKDGAAPEGKPKGSTKSEAKQRKQPKNARQITESLLEMTSCASIPANEGPPPVMANTGPNWQKRLAALRKRRGEKTDDERM